MRNDDGNSIQVLDRAAALLGELARQERPVPLAELATATDLSRSTARRVLASLEAHGFCERRAPGVYALGMRLMELGTLVGDRLDLRELARPELEQLADSTSLSAFLYVRRADRAICIDRINGRYAHTMATTVGGTLPLHVGAGSKAMLASSEPEDIQRFLDEVGELPRMTDRTITSHGALLVELQTGRERGWAVSYEEMTEGVSAIGASIIDQADSVAGAISISGLTPHIFNGSTDDLVGRVVAAAAAVSRRFRFEKHEIDSDVGGQVA